MFIQCLVDFKTLCKRDQNHYERKDKEVICPNPVVLHGVEHVSPKFSPPVKPLNDTNFLNYLLIVNTFLILTQ